MKLGILTVLTSLVALPAAASTVWVAPAAQKVRPQTQPAQGAAAAAHVSAAKNEFESFHVVVTGAASGVSMSLEGLSDGKGNTISGRDVTLYREALLNVRQPSGADGATGQWPDALVPDVDYLAGEKRNAFPFDVPANESRAVLVDIHVPEAAPAGTYSGVLHVTGGVTQDVPVKVTVWDFTMPSTATMRSAYALAWNGPCIGHGDANCTDMNREIPLRNRYVQMALDNRMTIDTPSIVGQPELDGSANWAAYDASVGQFLDGTAPTRLKGAKLTSVRLVSRQGWPNTAQSKSWWDHFAGKGWEKTLWNYVCDEPEAGCHYNEIDDRIAQQKAGAPQIPAVVTTAAQSAEQHGVKSIDIFAPVVNWMDDKADGNFPGNQRSHYGSPASTVWWYQSCMSFGCSGVGSEYMQAGAYNAGWPSLAVDTDGTRNRSQQWLAYTYDITGELYYETAQAYFSGDPWQDQYNFGGTGDGNLFYPGTPEKIGGQTEIPVESLRMKGLRDGMEDYELLAMADKLGLRDQAKAIAKGLFPATYLGTSTPAAVDTAREQLAALILHKLGKDVPAPTDGGSGTGSGSGTTGSGTAGLPVPGDSNGGGAPVSASDLFPHGGCSSTGPQQVWLFLPALAFFWASRRRRVVKA